MGCNPSSPFTDVLRAACGGDAGAVEQVLPLIYSELRALAQKYLLAERCDHTLQATALVHEAYLKLVKNDQIDWNGRGHFYTAAADAMRKILIDHARSHATAKRGGDWTNVSLKLVDLASGEGLSDLLAVDEALSSLGQIDPLAAKVVNLRFFAGLGVDEAAKVLNISPRSVDRQWQYAKAWLKTRLTEDGVGK